MVHLLLLLFRFAFEKLQATKLIIEPISVSSDSKIQQLLLDVTSTCCTGLWSQGGNGLTITVPFVIVRALKL